MKLSQTQILLGKFLQELGLCDENEPMFEYRFDDGRKWRADVALPSKRLLFEIEGGAWTRGRHTRGKGFLADLEKYNTATLCGWRVLRFSPEQVKSGWAKTFLDEWIT